MSCKITVVARVAEEGTWLGRLVESIDAQDLPYHDFEVLFLVPAPDSGAGQRLAELSRRRPNVRVAALTEDPATAAKAITGEWVLDLGTGLEISKPALFPQALSRLVGLGTAHACEAVLGRAVSATGNLVDDLLIADRPRLDGDAAAALRGSGQVVVLRRDLALAHGLAGPQGAGDWLAGARDIGVLGAYPSTLVSSPVPTAASASIQVLESTAQWRDGRILVTVSASSGDTDAGEVLFSVRQQDSGLEYWLPGTTANRAGGTLSGTAEIDVRTAALGTPLADGIWTVSVGVIGDPPGRHVRSPLPPMPLTPGIVDGTPVVPAQSGAAFAIDIGASRYGLVPRLSPADVSITESGRGTLLTIRLERLAVHGDSCLTGSLHLDKFPLPAALHAADGRARIECFLSGLAGTNPLSAQFGGGKPKPTGLNLEISPTGIMSVASAPDQSAAAPVPVRPGVKPGEESAIARLRRSVPAPIEPAVQSLARNKIAARVYRALVNGRPERH